MTETFFTPSDIENLARLVNYFGIIGGQLIGRNRPDQYARAHASLQSFRRSNKQLLERIDGMARNAGGESALRLAEDLERAPADVAHALNLARRCLLASAYLARCIAMVDRPAEARPVEPQPHKMLH
jgi:hypothetical protein